MIDRYVKERREINRDDSWIIEIIYEIETIVRYVKERR